jgi:hypothetical protein
MSITIKSAWYGYFNEKAHNVTSAIQAKIGNPQKDISFTVNPTELGLSGLSVNSRALTVTFQYTSTGPALTKSVFDGKNMKLNASPLNRIIFNKVTYGTDSLFIDITKEFQEAMWLNSDNLIFTVGSEKFLGQYCRADIAKFVPKTLCLDYTWDGQPQETIVARDGDNINMNFGPEH